MNPNKPVIVILGRQNSSTRILYHSLKDNFNIQKVIEEKPISRMKFVMRRVKKLGFFRVAGQILFQLFMLPLLKLGAGKRVEEIKNTFSLLDEKIDNDVLSYTDSVNDANTIELLQKMSPDVVIVSGTRIISKKVLESVSAIFINIHAGITPMFRGVHGGYWALVNRDKENCGVTIHLVDSGIDTGRILKQKKIVITGKDNFATYPYLQLGEGIKLMKEVLEEVKSGNIRHEQQKKGESKLWYHPTVWEYLYYRITRKVR